MHFSCSLLNKGLNACAVVNEIYGLIKIPLTTVKRIAYILKKS